MIKQKLANALTTPPEMLDVLSNDDEWRVRYLVANNPNAQPETLETLSNDEEWLVRSNVADNPNTPKYLKTHHYYDEYFDPL